jgi:hypothetical protein
MCRLNPKGDITKYMQIQSKGQMNFAVVVTAKTFSGHS